MKIMLLQLITLLAIGCSKGYAQSIPNITVPKEELSLYKNLQSNYITKNTHFFNLRGNVKSMEETIIKDSPKLKPDTAKSIRYEFMDNKLLKLYKEYQNGKSWINSDCIIEDYHFNSSSTKLLAIELFNGGIGYSHKTTKLFDKEGFESQETYECFDCGYDKKDDINVFNYTLKYYWTKNRDSAYLNYYYNTPYSNYDRFKDYIQSFVYEKKQIANKDTTPTPQFNFGLSPVNQITKDKKGNIIKWLIIDNSIKNSFNVDHLLEYKYDDKDNLIEHIHSSLTHGGANYDKSNFRPIQKYTISYLEYDTIGNWIIKKVKEEGKSDTYIYKRQIKYY